MPLMEYRERHREALEGTQSRQPGETGTHTYRQVGPDDVACSRCGHEPWMSPTVCTPHVE